jgi:hypothetical protein
VRDGKIMSCIVCWIIKLFLEKRARGDNKKRAKIIEKRVKAVGETKNKKILYIHKIVSLAPGSFKTFMIL